MREGWEGGVNTKKINNPLYHFRCYFLFLITPFPVSPKGERLCPLLLPPWGNSEKIGREWGVNTKK
jgi:hypothetical protein